MQEALYNPEHGYYASGRVNIGKQGDFFTNVSIGKIYGHILTFVFQEVWERLGKPQEFFIVEQGAHDGRLAHDILETLQEVQSERRDFAASIHYYIVEPLPFHRKRQQETLKNFTNIAWVSTIQELPLFEGVHFSNELLDAFPIHLLSWDGSVWLEKRVTTNDGQHFSWITKPIENKALHKVALSLPTHLPIGFQWEVRLGVQPWLDDIAKRMKRGVILIADYGYAGDDRFAPYRKDGSIACYQGHHRYDNPLEKPGQRDISAHVDFTDLTTKALETGWDILGYNDQHHFLIGASEQWLRSFEEKTLDASTQKNLRYLRTLLHPETMGRQFKFLGLGRNIFLESPLSAFRYGNHLT
ncbi:MAG: hypothetical protein A3F67_02430 [Verrucomicrobia bacterium RIFCSPHIGHO2_12_FULL_41_10]|nr:MAG: hypothetical protein A3F67_02430 [Verrucomicrobia bacterium RIFCSPHIGHO2_12_FULL_41_10]